MSGNILLYVFCLIMNMPILLSARSKTWSNKPQIETPDSYESLEILPYISSKLADRTNIMTEKIDEHNKDKLLTLFTNTKKEVDEKMMWLNKLHGYFNATYDAMFGVYSFYRKLKQSLSFLTYLGFGVRKGSEIMARSIIARKIFRFDPPLDRWGWRRINLAMVSLPLFTLVGFFFVLCEPLKFAVKDAEAFLSEMLRVLQNLFAKKPQQENGKPPSKQHDGQNIAWSYYDDLGK